MSKSVAAVTIDDLDDLRHMLGMNGPRRLWGYRNYYCADPQHPGMRRLEALGWVRSTRAPVVGPGNQVFVATLEGAKAVGLPEAKIARLFQATDK